MLFPKFPGRSLVERDALWMPLFVLGMVMASVGKCVDHQSAVVGIRVAGVVDFCTLADSAVPIDFSVGLHSIPGGVAL